MSNDDGRVIDRRTVLTTGAVALGAGLAGCTGNGGTSETTTDQTGTTDQTEATQTATESETTDSVALDEPAEPTESDRCAVCNMTVANFPEWNAQLTLEGDGGRRAFTCSPGCLVTLAAKPGQFVDGATGDDVANAWARDRTTTDLVDATTASWVLDPDDERAGGPMSGNPLPFAEEADAESYVAEYDDLTKHAIVGFDAFDAALAATYRGRFLPDATDSSVLDAVEVPDDATCPVCGMQPAKFPDANAQVAFEDGGREFPCSPGCLGAFYADTAAFADEREQDGIVSAWVHDYGTDELIDALEAWFVLETNGERVSDLPMKTNPVPYAERADAESYVEQYDDLTADDVVRLTDFTTELGKQYRAKHY
ncbi:nitrous oxide reductase accessory protein NosL [Halorussus ruber]|uniref:nitrous oxide reductase accessory protein NosL n=1 Tax=Halorussus ruber TaxID=1126238 RepID=UPI001092FCAE|nr:nitrous oxide reductase accessory protein NosL [Halorussus ruber]